MMHNNILSGRQCEAMKVLPFSIGLRPTVLSH